VHPVALMVLSAFNVQACLGLGVAATAFVVYLTRRHDAANDAAGKADSGGHSFRAFQRIYLCVYLTAMMADWLQGPYVYALYESYGFSRDDNAMLFVCGFGSSAIFGTFIGGLADRHGRRKFAGLYCLLYVVSCMTKHVNSYPILMIGRLTGGVATSLLFSVFDSWLVSEHNCRGFDAELLGSTFSLAMFGNSLVAIAAGELGQIASDMQALTPIAGNISYGGYCLPFDMAICFCVMCGALLMVTWSENYGQRSGTPSVGAASSSTSDGLAHAVRVVLQQPLVFSLGLVCALFEASMFIFVFNWTPTLTEQDQPKPPYGHIFASFMVMSMLGSQLFSLITKYISVEQTGRLTLIFSVCCHAVPVLTGDVFLRYASFLVFEICVGLYFPMMGTLKGQIVPEESRAGIYNLYRLPLNVIVVAALVLKIDTITTFTMTTGMLIIGAVLQTRLIQLRKGGAANTYRPVSFSQDVDFGLDDDPMPAALGRGAV